MGAGWVLVDGAAFVVPWSTAIQRLTNTHSMSSTPQHRAHRAATNGIMNWDSRLFPVFNRDASGQSKQQKARFFEEQIGWSSLRNTNRLGGPCHCP